MATTRKPGHENLSPAILRETVEDLKKIGIHDRNTIEIALSQTIIINSLGGDFWAKECSSFGAKQPFFAQKSDVRIVHLANMLWCLRDCAGFSDFLAKNDRNAFEATYYECAAAHWFLRGSSRIRFVVPKRARGADFDLLVYGFWTGRDLNVEVKARTAVFSTAKQLRNFLSSHRSQLPANESGVIFCKLEKPEDGIDQDAIIRATKQYVSGTSRIDFVIFCWDGTTQTNALTLKYFAVNSTGRMDPIFPPATEVSVPRFMSDAGL